MRSLFGLTALCALSLGIWKAFIYEPPTHKFPPYEKAPAMPGLAARVGPNTVAIASVARNSADGSVQVESGHGKSVTASPPGEKLLASCASWLDVAQVELTPGPDRLEIIEVRIFDHQSHAMLSEVDKAFGWQVVRPNLLQIYGLGKEIPPVLDVWLRVHSHPAGERVLALPAEAGASVSAPGGTLTVREVQDGFAGWDSRTGFYPADEENLSGSAILLEWDGDWPSPWYQVAAVSSDGEMQFDDRYIDVGRPGERREVIVLDFPLDEIARLEIRPFGGRHRFFFEAVQLPNSSGRSFASPPIISVPVNQSEMQVVLAELAPLRIRLAAKSGDCARGSWSNGIRSRIHLRSEPQDVDTSFTLFDEVIGVGGSRIAVRVQDSQTGGFVAENALGLRRAHRASGATHESSARTFTIPLERVDAVEVSVEVSP